MIMTAELNSHQRVSYYTGAKLIRHHQSASTANPNNSTSNNRNSNNNNSANGNTSGVAFYHHQHHYPPHAHHHHPHPPQLPPHHLGGGHFHLQCPTGPPHIQHPGGGVLHLNSHHGPPHHHHHHNGHHHFGGSGGSNQTTRLYTGSPLIRSTGYHTSNSVSGGGGLGNGKRAFKNHQSRNNHHSNPKGGGVVGSPGHYLNQNIIGGSCSSGTSSSSSSNEHLNNLQSPTGSPVAQTKLDISPLKLSSSPTLNGSESSSSNNSSPGPQGSPSPSTSSNLSTSSSPNSTDGNKDLDHFYFLDEHWKPCSDVNDTGIGISPADILDAGSSRNNIAHWSNSNSESLSTATTLTMMVDQFFANGHSNNFGLVDGNNNFIGINRDEVGGGLLRDLNNNIIGVQQSDLNEIHPRRNDHFDNSNSLSGNNSNNNFSGGIEGSSGLFNYEPGVAKFDGIHSSPSSSPSTANTVVNVETQIGTFNGQRDLEIRLCFIKGDHHNKSHHRSIFGENDQTNSSCPFASKMNNVGGGNEENKTVTAIGDPFMSSRTEQSEMINSRNGATSSDAGKIIDNKGEPTQS